MGRPRKIKTEDENSTNSSSLSKKHLSVSERQEINLKKHKARLESKKSKLENRDEGTFFCKNKDLLAELIAWRDSAEKVEDRVISEKLVLTIQHIAKKLTNHSNFSRYSNELKEEMVSYAIYKSIKGLKHYNFNFENPFGYFTQACWNSFVIVCSKYYKHLNMQRELVKSSISQMELENDLQRKRMYTDFIKQYLGEEFVESDEFFDQENTSSEE